MNKKPYYITTPIYYVNDIPHIGHTCTTLVADILARSQKDSFFLTGTDEHGAKIAEAAKKADKQPLNFADEVSQRFIESWKLLNINYDYFIRTTDEKHKKLAQDFMQKLYEKGDIYKGKYEGLYCIGCEKFITEKELVDGKCPLHSREPERQSEENYFFRLSKYTNKVKELIESNEFLIEPENKRKEVLNKINNGVEDLSVSRANVEWGIPIPWDKKHTIYVWFEALLNYWTTPQILGKNLWPADLHLIGKEIAWFHCVIWPAMLLACGEELPKKVFVHDFYNLKGEKMSKSLGNVITPQALVEKYGVDGTRYLLAAFFPFSTDTALSQELMDEKYNADLANGLGNLVSRVAKLAEKMEISMSNPNSNSDPSSVSKSEPDINLPQSLNGVWEKLRKLDKGLNEKQPWKLAESEAKPVLEKLISELLKINIELKPFMPETCEKIEKIFAASPIKATSPLFPKI